MNQIYVIQCGNLPYFKIGITSKSIRSRLSALQTGCPFELRLCGLWDGTVEEERRWHEDYSEFCVGGEWFRLEGPDVEIFQDCGFDLDQLRDPDIRACSVPDWCREVLAA